MLFFWRFRGRWIQIWSPFGPKNSGSSYIGFCRLCLSATVVLVPSVVTNHAKVLTLTPSCLCARETFPLILEPSMLGAGGREWKNARDGDSGISAGAVGPQGSIINDWLLLKRRMHATGQSLMIPDRTSKPERLSARLLRSSRYAYSRGCQTSDSEADLRSIKSTILVSI